MLSSIKSQRGFTLLELIVVLVILGLLAAIAIPTFMRVIEKSEDSTAKTSAESIARNAIALAAFDGRGLPSAGEVSTAAGEAGGSSTNYSLTGTGAKVEISTMSKTVCVEFTEASRTASGTVGAC